MMRSTGHLLLTYLINVLLSFQTLGRRHTYIVYLPAYFLTEIIGLMLTDTDVPLYLGVRNQMTIRTALLGGH